MLAQPQMLITTAPSKTDNLTEGFMGTPTHDVIRILQPLRFRKMFELCVVA